MSFTGINIESRRGSASNVNYGFAGFNITIPNLIPVRVVDSRGRGQANVILTAANGSTFSEFIANTDSLGNALMQLDATTAIVIQKELIKKTVNYDGENIITFEIDLPFLP